MSICVSALQGPFAIVPITSLEISVWDLKQELLKVLMQCDQSNQERFASLEAASCFHFSFRNAKLVDEQKSLLDYGLKVGSTVKLVSSEPIFHSLPVLAVKQVKFVTLKPLPPVLVYEDWLFQCGQTSVRFDKFHYLNQLQITHIVNLTEEVKYDPPEHITLFFFPLADHESADAMNIFKLVFQEIVKARAKNEKAKFVIHCSAGVSRSCAVTIAVLMQVAKWNLEKSFNHLKERRDEAKYGNTRPNSGFMYQLKQLETMLK